MLMSDRNMFPKEMIMGRSQVAAAYTYALRHHAGQFRKYVDKVDYITHPVAVATMVSEWIDNDAYLDANSEILSAALLHDIVEDTDRTIEMIEHKFGATVAKYVWFLTDTPKYVGNRISRHRLDLVRLAQAPDDVKAIKFFDNVHNMRSIAQHDPKFFEVYLIEKNMLARYVEYSEVQVYGRRLPLEFITEKHIKSNPL